MTNFGQFDDLLHVGVDRQRLARDRVGDDVMAVRRRPMPRLRSSAVRSNRFGGATRRQGARCSSDSSEAVGDLQEPGQADVTAAELDRVALGYVLRHKEQECAVR